MSGFPEGLAGFNLNEPNKPLELTDIAYAHRANNLRQSEAKYQEMHGEPYQCPTCRKHTYTNLEGGDSSPDCDSCYAAGESLGLPPTRWEASIPRVSDLEKDKKAKKYTKMDVEQYRNHGWNTVFGAPSELPEGPYSCAEPNQLNKHRTCNQKFDDIESLADHWTHDAEHHDAWGKD